MLVLQVSVRSSTVSQARSSGRHYSLSPEKKRPKLSSINHSPTAAAAAAAVAAAAAAAANGAVWGMEDGQGPGSWDSEWEIQGHRQQRRLSEQLQPGAVRSRPVFPSSPGGRQRSPSATGRGPPAHHSFPGSPFQSPAAGRALPGSPVQQRQQQRPQQPWDADEKEYLDLQQVHVVVGAAGPKAGRQYSPSTSPIPWQNYAQQQHQYQYHQQQQQSPRQGRPSQAGSAPGSRQLSSPTGAGLFGGAEPRYGIDDSSGYGRSRLSQGPVRRPRSSSRAEGPGLGLASVGQQVAAQRVRQGASSPGARAQSPAGLTLQQQQGWRRQQELQSEEGGDGSGYGGGVLRQLRGWEERGVQPGGYDDPYSPYER
jgi:hypothetical protein